MDSMRSLVDIGGGKDRRNVLYVMTSVRVSVMYCESVQPTVALEVTLCASCKDDFQSLDSFRKASFMLGSELWVSSLLDLVKRYVVEVWELRKVRWR